MPFARYAITLFALGGASAAIADSTTCTKIGAMVNCQHHPGLQLSQPDYSILLNNGPTVNDTVQNAIRQQQENELRRLQIERERRELALPITAAQPPAMSDKQAAKSRQAAP